MREMRGAAEFLRRGGEGEGREEVGVCVRYTRGDGERSRPLPVPGLHGTSPRDPTRARGSREGGPAASVPPVASRPP